MVPKKIGDQLWEEFLGACNKFFEARNAAGAGQRGEERQLLSHVQLFATPWTAAYQAPPSMGFSRQEYWSGVPLPSPAWV